MRSERRNQTQLLFTCLGLLLFGGCICHIAQPNSKYCLLLFVIFIPKNTPVDHKLWYKYVNKLQFDAEPVHLIDPRVPYVNPTSFPGVSRSQAQALLEIACLS